MDQQEFFAREGFAVLPKFFNDQVIDEALKQIDAKKHERPVDIVVDLLDTGERTVLGLLSPDEIKTRRMKINDLYLDVPEVRALALAEKVVPVLKKLLANTPVLCNSLYFEKGSAQPAHVDSLYMTPRTHKHLIAIWVALEDTHADAGQLEYYPGSHLIEQMKFSSGDYHFIPDEMPKWHGYMDNAVKDAGLKKATFSAKKGDVFIWHANLLHGGGPIKNPDLTRKSLVFHFYSATDCRSMGNSLMPQAGAYWIKRPPQALPEQIIAKLQFSEEGYLSLYPDVAEAVKAGTFISGKAHYEAFGRNEGRLPIASCTNSTSRSFLSIAISLIRKLQSLAN